MKYSPEMTQEIASLLANGSNRTDACVMAGISYETFTVWMQKPEFSEAIKKAETGFKNENIAIVFRAAQKSWQAGAWLLERKYWQEFALKKDTDTIDDTAKKIAKKAFDVLKEIENRNEKVAIHS
jgi:hypothetical protein